MIHKKRISVVIPCRNEEVAIRSSIKNMPKYIDEIIVVDNRSTDRTTQVARSLGAIVIKEDRTVDGIGYGYAHMSGLKRATGDIIVTLDGDGTYPSHEIKEIVHYMLAKKLDLVSCSRFPLKNYRAISKVRQLGVLVLNTAVSFLYGYPIRDILTGMWAIRSDIKDKINLRQGGWDLSPEIKLNAICNPEINFDEYHIGHEERVGDSKQNIWKTGINHLLYIIKRRFTSDLFTKVDSKVSTQKQISIAFNNFRLLLA